MELSVTEISAMVAAAGVLVGVVYYILDLRNQNRIRQTDLIMRLSSVMDDFEFTNIITKLLSTDFKDVSETRKEISPAAMTAVANYFHRVGVLLERNLVDADMVNAILYVQGIWEKMNPWITYVRQTYKLPKIFDGFEYLYNEMRKREQKLQQ
jgi:Domain of unknown function (DUF4760)